MPVCLSSPSIRGGRRLRRVKEEEEEEEEEEEVEVEEEEEERVEVDSATSDKDLCDVFLFSRDCDRGMCGFATLIRH